METHLLWQWYLSYSDPIFLHTLLQMLGNESVLSSKTDVLSWDHNFQLFQYKYNKNIAFFFLSSNQSNLLWVPSSSVSSSTFMQLVDLWLVKVFLQWTNRHKPMKCYFVVRSVLSRSEYSKSIVSVAMSWSITVDIDLSDYYSIGLLNEERRE